MELAIEAYNKASYELDQVNAAIATNKRHLEIAKGALKTAQKNLADRIVALYTSNQQDALEVILGAANLDDLLDRVDSVRRISNQDVQIIDAVRVARNEVQRREKELERDQARQQQVVAEKASQQAAVEAQLAERQSLYESIKGQIADLEAEERARQAQLAAEAEARQEEQERVAAAAESAGVSVSDTTVISEPSGIGVAPPSTHGGSVVGIALSFLGTPYVWGGASPGGFDCSGLVVYVFAQVGISLPHYTGALWNVGVPVSYGGAPARRPRLLQRPRSRRHLHRRRPDGALAAHGGRRQDLGYQLGLLRIFVRRRPPRRLRGSDLAKIAARNIAPIQCQNARCHLTGNHAAANLPGVVRAIEML